GGARLAPAELEPSPVARDHPHERRPRGERERDVPGGMRDVEGNAAGRDRQVALERLLAAIAHHDREVEERAVGESGETAGDREADAAEATPGDRGEPGARQADQ